MRKLTEQDVRKIPELYEKYQDLTLVAEELGIGVRQLQIHIKKLNELGEDIKVKRGPKPILK